MSMEREVILRTLDDINCGIVLDSKVNDLKNIQKVAFINYKGLEGRLIWDCELEIFNELIFVENRSGKYFSLGTTKHKARVEDVFYHLAKKYGKDGQRLVSQIVITYDSDKAKETVQKLYKYILLKKKLNAIVLNIKEYKYLKKKNQIEAEKEILFGHHSLAKDMIKIFGMQEIACGISIGYDAHTCVLMAKRSDYSGNSGKWKFGTYYQKKMKECEISAKELEISTDFDSNKRTAASMYDCLLTAVVEEKYLDSFLELEYTNYSMERQDELCMELKQNPICKKYITSYSLEEICREKKFLTNKGKKTDIAWNDLYELDDWHIQRYWIKDYCRIINYKEQTEVYGTVEQIICQILEYCHREELKEKITQRDWGIVFCGGGGKGAYQIGVWKWLKEHGIADKITGVSGASVGALNSLLFVEGDCDLAEQIWNSVTPAIIVNPDEIPIGQDQDELSEFLEKHMGEMKNICKQEKLVYSALTCVDGFPRKAMLGYLQKKEVPDTSTIKANYYCWASRTKEEIREIVLASAALPGIKRIRKFEGKEFVDGGFRDNVPVRPLAEDGFRNIIVVQLSDNEEAFKKSTEHYKNVKFHHVKPSKSLGKMTQTGAALTKYRIKCGYEDAASQLQEILLLINN